MPMTLLFLLLFTGLGLIWFSKKKGNKVGRIILTATTILLFLVCFPPVSTVFMQNLESTYPAISHVDTQIKYIWVLGSASASDTSMSLHSRLYQDGLYRVLEGVRLYKEIPEVRLIFSGYGAGDIQSVAEIGAEVAISLGVPKENITTLSKPMDTWDEAVAAKELIGDSPFILVTSASHMKRSIFIFNQNGLNPVPAPCGHFIKKRNGKSFHRFLPSAHSAVLMRRYIHEQLGLLWLKILIFFSQTDYA